MEVLSEMKAEDNFLGYMIKDARVKKNLTQAKLAEEAGITNGYLIEIENKRSIPSFPVMAAIFKALNLSADAVIYRNPDLNEDKVRQINNLLSQCNDHQLNVIYAMVDAMLNADC